MNLPEKLISNKPIVFLGVKTEKFFILNLAFVIFLSIVVGLTYGLMSQSKIDDVDGFAWLSKYFADHTSFVPTLRRGPLYSIIFGTFIKMFGFNNMVTIAFQTIFLATLSSLTYILSYKLFRKFKYAVLTGILVAINPMCFNYVAKNLVELVFAVLILLQLWFAYKSITHPNYKNYIIFGIFSGLSALCKSVSLLFPIFFVISIILFKLFKVTVFRNISINSLFKLLITSFVIMLLTISPWTIRNYKVFGSFTLISNGAGYEFLRGKYIAQENAFYDLRKTNTEIWNKFFIEYYEILHKYELKDDIEIQKRLDIIMKEYIINNPIGFAERTLKQIPTFWMRGDGWKKSMVYLSLSVFLISFFILGFLRLYKKSLFAYVVLIAAVYFNLIYAAILAIGRYSMPLYPPMLIIGTVGLVYLYQRVFRHSDYEKDIKVYTENPL